MVCSSSRLADAFLGLGPVALEGRLDGAAALAGLALDPVAGFARFGRRFAAGGVAAALGALDGPAHARPVGLDLALGAGPVGERFDQLGDVVADLEDDADGEVDGGFGDALGAVGRGGRGLDGAVGLAALALVVFALLVLLWVGMKLGPFGELAWLG